MPLDDKNYEEAIDTAERWVSGGEPNLESRRVAEALLDLHATRSAIQPAELAMLLNDITSNAAIGSPDWSGIEERIVAILLALKNAAPQAGGTPKGPHTGDEPDLNHPAAAAPLPYIAPTIRPEDGSMDDFAEMCELVGKVVGAKTNGDAVGHIAGYRKRVRETCLSPSAIQPALRTDVRRLVDSVVAMFEKHTGEMANWPEWDELSLSLHSLPESHTEQVTEKQP